MKNKLFKLLTTTLTFVLILALSIGAFSWIAKVNTTANAEHTATSTYSDDFNKESSWTTEQSSAVDQTVFNGTSAKVDLTNFPIGFTAPESAASDSDNYCLGLFANGAPAETGAENEAVYNRLKKSISGLTKNSYYVISFYALTSDAKATIKLTGSIEYESQQFSNTEWIKYYIFVATPVETYSSLYVNFSLGSYEKIATSGSVTGYALFDALEIETITEKDFVNQTISSTSITDTDAHNISSFDANASRSVAIPTVDSDFSNTLDVYSHFEEEMEFSKATASTHDWYYYAPEDLTTLAKNNYYYAYNETDSSTNKAYFVAETIEETNVFGNSTTPVNTFSVNNYALKLTNRTQDYKLGLVSKEFTLNQLGIYRISVMVKSTSNSNKATVMLIANMPTNSEPDGSKLSATKSISPYTTSSSKTNNWYEAVIYVRGSALRDVQTRIVLLADANSTVYFDHIKVTKITTSEYPTSSSSNTLLDLSASTILQSDSIPNGHFNYANITDENINTPYLLEPNEFTHDNVSYEDVKAGVVPSNNNIYRAGSNLESALGMVENPITNNVKVNMLAIYSPAIAFDTEKTYSYLFTTKDSFSLSSEKTYVISFDAYAANTAGTTGDFDGNLIAKLIFNDNTIVDFDYDLSETGTWSTYRIIVRTGTSSRSFKLSFGIGKATGTIFFKNVEYKEYVQDYDDLLTTNSTWDNQLANKIRFVDFLNENATAHTQAKVEDQDYFKSNLYTVTKVEEDSQVVSGDIVIIDTTHSCTLSTETILGDNYLYLENAKSDSALLLWNDGAKQSIAKPYSTTTLTKDSFYRISVWVKASTNAMEHLVVNFSGLNIQFTLNENATDNNNYTEYVAYVKTGSSDKTGVSLTFTLGTADNKVDGYAIIRDIEYAKIDETEYNLNVHTIDAVEDKSTLTSNYVSYAVAADSSADSNNSNDEENEENNVVEENNNNTVNPIATFFIVFSSIILVASTVLAIVAVRIKKIYKPSKPAVTNVANVKPKSTKSAKKRNKRPEGFV